jgi:hypothetical protein
MGKGTVKRLALFKSKVFAVKSNLMLEGSFSL